MGCSIGPESLATGSAGHRHHLFQGERAEIVSVLGAEDQFETSRKEGQRESLLLDLTVLTFPFTNHCRDRDPKKLQFLEPKRGRTEVFFSVLYRNVVQPFRLFSSIDDDDNDDDSDVHPNVEVENRTKQESEPAVCSSSNNVNFEKVNSCDSIATGDGVLGGFSPSAKMGNPYCKM
ncbi:hypothetical protein NC652_025866 [Populus alba x Populus x berolinensis]|nr:hypothetical protein NC652_025866 [Populus alba x Populus x berolinensis]